MVLFLYLYTERPVFAIGPGFAGVINPIVDRVGLLPQSGRDTMMLTMKQKLMQHGTVADHQRRIC